MIEVVKTWELRIFFDAEKISRRKLFLEIVTKTDAPQTSRKVGIVLKLFSSLCDSRGYGTVASNKLKCCCKFHR